MTAIEILKLAKSAPSRFKRNEARVSAVSNCARRQVAIAIGSIDSDFDDYYTRAGRQLERWVYEQISSVVKCYEQVSVPTSIENVYCHPDIVIPSENLCVQIKSCSDAFAYSKKAKEHAIHQTMLEWEFFRQAGYFITTENERIDFLPSHYSILYLGRESAGGVTHEEMLHYDSLLAARLLNRFQEIQMNIDLGILPGKEKRSPDMECSYRGKNCGMFDYCWGGGSK